MIAQLFLVIFAAASTTPAEAAAFRRSAPNYLPSDDVAYEHLVAARAASSVYAVDPDLLLATAYGESNYQQRVKYREVVRGRHEGHSCGVMTPQPTRDAAVCDQAQASLFDGYLAGARHLRECLTACRGNLYCALSWYAGGIDFITNCRDRPEQYKKQCQIPGNRLWRAQWIRDLRRARPAPQVM